MPLWPSLQRIDAQARIAEEPLELLRRIEIFARLPEPVLERLAAGATAVSVVAEQVVVSRGEAGNHFYVIADGRAGVELDDGTLRELGPDAKPLQIVARVYADVDKRLWPAARSSVKAQLAYLRSQG